MMIAASRRGAEAQSRPHWSGDLRIRYENNSNLDDLPGRNRSSMRGRIGGTLDVHESIRIGARLATGNPDDPKSTEVTFGSFVDDFDVSVDRLYLELRLDDLTLTGGKFANPFLRTDLVWDGDVNPQGAAGRYTFSSASVTATVAGAFSIVDEQSAGPDSYMVGGQGSVTIRTSQTWKATFAVAYYDYAIRSLVNADPGDIRSNRLTLDHSTYLSDFDLFDVIAIVEHAGFGELLPLRLVANYVKNLGAANDEDDAFSADLFVGRAAERGEYRLGYGYSRAQTDAVLAAFSNDNTTIATNYRQHTVTFDYVALPRITLQVRWYLHRRDRLGTTPTTDSDEFVSRLRLVTLVTF